MAKVDRLIALVDVLETQFALFRTTVANLLEPTGAAANHI